MEGVGEEGGREGGREGESDPETEQPAAAATAGGGRTAEIIVLVDDAHASVTRRVTRTVTRTVTQTVSSQWTMYLVSDSQVTQTVAQKVNWRDDSKE